MFVQGFLRRELAITMLHRAFIELLMKTYSITIKRPRPAISGSKAQEQPQLLVRLGQQHQIAKSPSSRPRYCCQDTTSANSHDIKRHSTHNAIGAHQAPTTSTRKNDHDHGHRADAHGVRRRHAKTASVSKKRQPPREPNVKTSSQSPFS